MTTSKKEQPEYLVALQHALQYPDRALFLDIETAGTRASQYTTVIGWAIGGEYKHWIKRQPLQSFHRDLARAKVIVTFNGRAFDVPFLLKEFPDMKFPEFHLDLMHLLWAKGMKGGQKILEKTIGIMRPSDLGDLRGWDAIKLWRAFGRTRDRAHLDMLIRYNREDVMNMIPLLAHGAQLHDFDAEPIRRLTGESDDDIIWV